MTHSKQKSSKSKSPSKKTPSKPKNTTPNPTTNDSHKTESLTRPPPTTEIINEGGVYNTESLPFTPVENPYEQVFDASSTPVSKESVSNFPNAEPKQLEAEDYLDQCYIDFGEPQNVQLRNDKNDSKSLSQIESAQTTIVDTESLPTVPNNFPLEISHDGVIYDISKNSKKLASCKWWKARSIQCSKCQVQPLCTRQRPTGGGYGLIRSHSTGDDKKLNDHQLKVGKVIPGLCSSCSPYSSDENSLRCGSGSGDRNGRSGVRESHTISNNNNNACDCTGKSEYQCAYAPPESQYLIRQRHHRSGSVRDKEAYLQMLHRLLRRPPWNYSTSVPPPKTWVESIRAAEANLRALDQLIMSKEETKKRHHNSCSKKDDKSNCKNETKKSPALSQKLQRNKNTDDDCQSSTSFDTYTTEEED